MNTFPYKIETKYGWKSPKEIAEMRQWLKNNTGEPYHDWISYIGHSPLGEYIFCVNFRNEKDAILFALAW